jgi:hypothetical protein
MALDITKIHAKLTAQITDAEQEIDDQLLNEIAENPGLDVFQVRINNNHDIITVNEVLPKYFLEGWSSIKVYYVKYGVMIQFVPSKELRELILSVYTTLPKEDQPITPEHRALKI